MAENARQMATPQVIAELIGLANNSGVPNESDKPNPAPRPVAPITEQIATLELDCKYRMVKIRQAGHMRDVLQLG
ncbi:MAG: hypothetical protein ACKO1K_06365, partial [Burkholderiales bacterium]